MTQQTAVIYARVSSREQQQEGYSIDAQLKLARSFAAKNGFEIEQEFGRFAKDIGVDFDELDLVLWSMKTGEILK